MHLLTKASVEIKQPIALVFEYTVNMERFGDWFPGVLSIKSANDLKHAQVGKEYLETVNIPLKGEEKIKLTVTEVSGTSKFVTEGEFAPLFPRMEISFTEKNSESSVVVWHMFSRNTNFLFKIFLLPFVKLIIAKRAARGVQNLKRQLEKARAQIP